ncbi:MAG: GyrI-like domain-containing protein [Saprospiraceae bacterium]
MKALKYIGILLLTLIAIFLILGIVAPKKAHMERSINIAKAPAVVQDIVSRFSEESNWSPWVELDPNMTVSTEGVDGTVGSKYFWAGNRDAGKGNQTNTKVEPGLVERKVIFEKPMAGEAVVTMKLNAENGGTKATWIFDSESPYPMNAIGLFMPVDKFLGPQYEKGLSKLKAYAESKKLTSYRGYEVKEVDAPLRTYLGIRTTLSIQDIPKFLEASFGKISAAIAEAKIEMDGMPAGLYYTYDEKSGITDMAAVIPVKGKPTLAGISTIQLPAGKEVSTDHLGSYEKIGEAHFAIDDYCKAKGLKQGSPAIEQYSNDPMMEKDTSKWITRVIYPIVQ